MRIVQVSVGSVRMPPEEEHAPLQVIFNTSRNLARLGHQVVILDRRHSRQDLAVELKDGVEIARLRVMQIRFGKAFGLLRFILAELNAILFALAVSRYVAKNSSNIDIVHLHLTSTGLVVSLLNRRLRSRMVYTCHLGQWVFAERKLTVLERVHLLLDSYLMKRVSKVIALNDAAKESFTSMGKVAPDAITVIPNGVDTEFFSPGIEGGENVRRKYGFEGRVAVLFVGRLSEIKGVDHLLRAADRIVNEFGHTNTVFVLVGSHIYAGVAKPVKIQDMMNFISRHRLDKNVILTGPVPLEEVRGFYPACDIFVLPSLAEGDPLAVVEAMASGKPIIGTKVGGIPHKVRDGWNGFLVDPGDEGQLADKIRYLIDNPDDRKRMGANSRRYAEEEFDWGKVAQRLELVYQGKRPNGEIASVGK